MPTCGGMSEIPLFSPSPFLNLDLDPIALKKTKRQERKEQGTFISSILGFKCLKMRG